jgi:hypothetical protein
MIPTGCDIVRGRKHRNFLARFIERRQGLQAVEDQAIETLRRYTVTDDEPCWFSHWGFQWPPQDNPLNTPKKRQKRLASIDGHHARTKEHVRERNGGCTQCGAVQAALVTCEAPAFQHYHCYYCHAGFSA